MTAGASQTYSVDDIKAMLHDRRRDVAYHYARPAKGSYEDKGGYWTLNPGRADRSVGSFVIWIDGPKAGRWNEYANGTNGDLIDLIALSLGCDLKTAFREARSYLGLQSDSPEDRARRQAAIERSKRQQAEAEAQARAARKKRADRAFALWLSARERIAGTPVEHYLRDVRGIDLAQLGRQPRALRFHPECFYQHTDPETGEVIRGHWPAMVALVTDARGNAVACHRTYLAMDDAGRWGKARLPEVKKVLGDYAGAAIHLWRGLGPRGGAGKRLAEAEPGSRVYLTEGIEDALSCVMVLPEARVLAAISLSNFGNVVLPEAISEVVIVADQDEGEEQRAALARAIEAHAKAGRIVRVWQNHHGGKDLNDALLRRAAEREGESDEGHGAGSGPDH